MEEANLIQNQQPSVQPENSFIKKNFTPKFIAVIVGILIIGGFAYGYATYLAKKNFNEVVRFAEEGKRLAEEFEQKRIDDLSTAGWQTYRNEEHGFEFKHPNYFEIQEYTEDDLWRIGNINKREADMWLVFDFIIRKANNQDLSVFIKNYFEYPEDIIKQEPLYSGTYIEFAGLPGYSYFQIFPKENLVIKFNSGEEFLKSKEFNKILSTFKFIEKDEICIQVITPARNPQTGETRDFPTPCDVPEGWEVVR